MELISHVDYYNWYGPTETNVITHYKVEQIPADQIKPIPIGKTCDNMGTFIVSEDGRLVIQPGEEGELYARGHCVAQGYWGDAEKTKSVFISNPFNPYFAEPVYKTGDLVTLDENGNYIFRGRKDDMIKSRGYRIELGEIESILYSHQKIKEAAVVAIPDELMGSRIKAFVIRQNKGVISDKDLREFCARKLPQYMVPETIEFSEMLPKTSTGKIDKTALIS
jgi:acyl-coenzyme A synthetase/AMP-(fatty) acid ligase